MATTKLRELREEAGLSQSEAAKLVGVPIKKWQRWEGGYSGAPIEHSTWTLFLLLTGKHPILEIKAKSKQSKQQREQS